MLKKHRNALLDVIREANLDPKKFTAKTEEVENYPAFRIQTGNGSLYFLIWSFANDDEYLFRGQFTTYQRSSPKPYFGLSRTFEPFNNKWKGFEQIKEDFKAWVNKYVSKFLKHQAEEEEDLLLPDMWAESELVSENFKTLQNTPFSDEEKKLIAEKFNEFEQRVDEENILSAEQKELLHDQVEYLVESSKRLGRKDWLAASAGALMGFVVNAGLTSEIATQIFQWSGESLRFIINTPLLLP